MDGTLTTEFLASLNSASRFAGHTDWRVPNQFELHSLLNLGALPSPVFAEFDAGCSAGCSVTTCTRTRTNCFRSSSMYSKDPSLAWQVSFHDGNAIPVEKNSTTCSARAARGGS